MELEALAALIRSAPGLQDKRGLQVLGPLSGDGDDGALVPHGDGWLVLCGEAISPELVAADPHSAGLAGVVTCVSDVRAMGGRPLGLVDMLVSPSAAHARLVIGGLAAAADLLGVPVVGGHLTLGGAPALSVSCTGAVRQPLRAAAARPGDALLVAFALEGRYRNARPYFSSLADRAPALLRSDGDVLAEVAEAGLCHAARDVSMPGVAGSLLQLLEAAGCGAVLDLDLLPRPDGVPLDRWVLTFPSFGFVLAAAPAAADEACAAFTRRGLACAVCGSFDDSRALRIAAGGATAEVWDLAADPLTGMGAA